MSSQWLMKSKFGSLYLVASEKGLQALLWKRHPAKMLQNLKGSSPEVIILSQAVKQLEEYFDGKRTQFDIPLDVEGTDFQKQVWFCLQKIPFGKTLSYRDIAKKIKKEKAVRAVGAANGKNPISIIIPCHRVIASNGSLQGYSGGLKMKAQLLQLESSL
jgi:methylated-DNA-[protein]-cysteine S-methyltransferase